MFVKKVFLTISLVTSLLSSSAQIEKAEADMICKFVENMKWPEEGGVSVGVLGNSRVLTELRNLIKRKKVPLKLGRVDFMKESLDYDMVFVPRGQKIDVELLVELIGNKPIAVVAESMEDGKIGADFCFLEEEGKLRFIINNTLATSKGLKIGDNLLDYATDIH